MIRYSVFILTFFAWSCGQTGTAHHHTPFARTDWEPLTPARSLTNSQTSKSTSHSEDMGDIREQMVVKAEDLLENGSESPGFGAEDLETIFSSIGVDVNWQASSRLDALVSLAKKKGAYKTDSGPDAGDVVLFHNQVDANGNGLVDDWLTGCGVVVDLNRPKFDAVVRTGHAPKLVTVWPDGPSRNTVSSETVNSYLRVPNRSDPQDTMYLAGQLYAGYIDIEQLVTKD